MRKIALLGPAFAMSTLFASQAYAQAAVVDAPLTLKTAVEFAKQQIRYVETKARDLQRLETELSQLQLAVKNAKRASPKLWDSSQNIFENVINAAGQVGTIADVSQDIEDSLRRAGCLNGVFQGGAGVTLVENPPLDYLANPRPEELVALRERNELEGRCMRLAASLKAKEGIKEIADEKMKDAEEQSKDPDKGIHQTLDAMLKGIYDMNASILKGQLAAENTKKVDLEREVNALQLQRSMHDRLMATPSSRKKIKGRDPVLTVDPRNY